MGLEVSRKMGLDVCRQNGARGLQKKWGQGVNLYYLFCQFVLKILSKNQILTSIKGRNSVANLRKTKIYNTNLDLVTDNVYTNFGLILSIRSQDVEQKPNFDVNQGP